MVHLSRRAAGVSIKVAAVLVAGAVALPALRRQLHEDSAPAPPDVATADPPQPAPASTHADPGNGPRGPAGDGDAGEEPAVGEWGQVEGGGVPGVVGEGNDAGDQATVGEPGHVRGGDAEGGSVPDHRCGKSRAERTWA